MWETTSQIATFGRRPWKCQVSDLCVKSLDKIVAIFVEKK